MRILINRIRDQVSRHARLQQPVRPFCPATRWPGRLFFDPTMTHETRVCDDHNFVVTTYRNEVSAGEIELSLVERADLARDRAGLIAICDFRYCQLKLSTGEVRILAARAAKAAEGRGASKQAILAADDLTFGIGRMFCAFTADQPVETQVFRDVDAMARWLGLDSTVVEGQLDPSG